MTVEEFTGRYADDPRLIRLAEALDSGKARIHLSGLLGSFSSVLIHGAFLRLKKTSVIVLPDKEQAAYYHNDLEALFGKNAPLLFFPESFRVPYEVNANDSANIALRAEVLSAVARSNKAWLVVTYPEALAERVVNKKTLRTNTYRIKQGESYSSEFIHEMMHTLGFDQVEYVYEPGQYSVRGGIIDVFSFANEYPFRIEFFGDDVDSIRWFNPVDQLSVKKVDHVEILPNISTQLTSENYQSLLEFIGEDALVWLNNLEFLIGRCQQEFENALTHFNNLNSPLEHQHPDKLYLTGEAVQRELLNFNLIETAPSAGPIFNQSIVFNIKPQPSFSKNFELLADNLKNNEKNGYTNLLFSGNPKQVERLHKIFEDIERDAHFTDVPVALHEGFIDTDQMLVCYTDHQIFERYHRFRLKEGFKKNQQAMTIRELSSLQPGDFVTHIDHGIGVFSGLQKIDVNGKEQEAIRLLYRDNDILYVSIHSLHRIAKYSGKDGTPPSVHKLGSGVWAKTKAKTKSRVKEIAYDLIKLYAKRKASAGFAYSPDNYLQTELEASFIYEDTPDQLKSTNDVKKDMEHAYPMDRLICGDVGFGKTEIAIRAAFKAVCDSKQVAVLVPTTILSFQHYKNFKERLKDFPCKVDYINRFKSAKAQTETLKQLASGEVDIIIGTHKLVGQKTKFKDLGLLIIDEEQKFGVGVKDKLKTMKEHVDTLTMTATPIPRTLQFSMMGARDLSIINTPPPNRYPVMTEVRPFSEDVIRDAVNYEVGRGGQVFLVNNKIQNIHEVAALVERMCPGVKVCVGHGQMNGDALEQVMMEFMDGEYDVLVATTIIESGIDIPNANTMIIMDAHRFGLSDLHQLRGRVGRSNKKAFCYLIAPPLQTLTNEARRRLTAIEQFSDLGSGLNIAMRDLDIRGAGDLLGADQSGFIADIGIETYQKILDEAVQELKESDFKELYADEDKGPLVKDCSLETDFEIMIPDDYISDIAERLQIYRDLDEISKPEELHKFKFDLEDRFGKIPKPTLELFEAIQLRWMAQEIGLEKLILKGGKLIAHFAASENSDYFQSAQFSQVLSTIQRFPHEYKMYEKDKQLRISHQGVRSIADAVQVMVPMVKEKAPQHQAQSTNT
jgi:transcription-repair coupling factor (superfamily II helicase)